MGGGLDTGRSVADSCFNVDSPQETALTIDGVNSCKVVTPWAAQSRVRVNGSVPLPYGFGFSGVYQDLPGPNVTATYSATLPEITPSLGRVLAGGARNANVSLIIPQSLREARVRRLDLRLTKSFQITPKVRLQANLDAYNAEFQCVQSLNTTYTAPGGRTWMRPNTILDPRILQISMNLNF